MLFNVISWIGVNRTCCAGITAEPVEIKQIAWKVFKSTEKAFVSYIKSWCTCVLILSDKLEASDLMPPICGYFGDLDLSKINDDEVKSACTVSKLCRNIFRIFLHTFTNSLSYDKFKDLPETERLKLNNLIEILKYKNYAEITKNL